MRISDNPLVLDAPDLFGRDKELYLKLREQGAGKDILLCVEQAMKHTPKPVRQALTMPMAKRKPVKSLEDRLWTRYRSTIIDPARKGTLLISGNTFVVPLPILLAFVSLLEEPGRFHAEGKALVNWQVTVLSYMLNGTLEPQTTYDPDEKSASQQIAKFFKGVIKLANPECNP